ncbi:pantetheine-phosphate adenylyltransferase [Candidatus Gottesmanbacteria bacterium]|nr:pantetheine-phosphate adenylyltransferase [Candidatus Gottesmanbacteria bacterium]
MYAHVFVAGTFDGLHKGHVALISEAFKQGERVTVGLTSDEFVRTYKSQISNHKSQTIFKSKIQTFKKRKADLKNWLEKEGVWRQSTIVPIDNPYEPATAVKGVDALIVTAETRRRGEEINALRQKRGLAELALIEMPLVNAEDGAPISSSRLRKGEIDRLGRLVMPESLRSILQKPLGKIFAGQAIAQAIARSSDRTVIAVGDVTTKTFLDAGRVPNLSIIDGKVGRRVVKKLVGATIPSGPGFISQEAVDAIKKGVPEILIDGEEDLLVLPAIIYAPLGGLVYYGQPNRGMVEVVVNGVTKKTAEKLLTQFLFAEVPGAT